MSYACAKTSGNSFFEPVDYNTVRAPISLFFKQGGSQMAQQLMAAAGLRANALATTTVPGPRLFVSGVITQSNNTASFVQVERPDGEPPLSPDSSPATIWCSAAAQAWNWRVWRVSLFTSTDDEQVGPNSPLTTTNNVGFFGATLLRATGVVTLELEHNGIVLAHYHAAAPCPRSISAARRPAPTTRSCPWPGRPAMQWRSTQHLGRVLARRQPLDAGWSGCG